MRQPGVDARLIRPQEAPGAPISPPAVPQHPPIAEPSALPVPAWDDLIGQARLLQRSSQIESARQAEDLRKRGMLMTAPNKPLNFNEALGEVMTGRWVSFEDAAREEMERREAPPVETCGDDFVC